MTGGKTNFSHSVSCLRVFLKCRWASKNVRLRHTPSCLKEMCDFLVGFGFNYQAKKLDGFSGTYVISLTWQLDRSGPACEPQTEESGREKWRSGRPPCTHLNYDTPPAENTRVNEVARQGIATTPRTALLFPKVKRRAALGGSRTHDTLQSRRVLYQLSYILMRSGKR